MQHSKPNEDAVAELILHGADVQLANVCSLSLSHAQERLIVVMSPDEATVLTTALCVEKVSKGSNSLQQRIAKATEMRARGL